MSPESPVETPVEGIAPVEVKHLIPDWEFRNQQFVVLYEAATARVGHRDALLWQSPALAMSAQAFLLTIALGHESSPLARLVSALLGLCVTFLSIQLMHKHRLHLWNEMILMHALEREMGMSVSAVDFAKQLKYIKDQDPLKEYTQPKTRNFLTKRESVRVWTWGLALFGVVNLLLVVASFLAIFGVAPVTLGM